MRKIQLSKLEYVLVPNEDGSSIRAVTLLLEGNVRTLNVSSNTIFPIGGNPKEFAVLIPTRKSENYSTCIVGLSGKEQREIQEEESEALLKEKIKQKQLRERSSIILREKIKVNDNIHLFSHNGIYEVSEILMNGIVVSCGIWDKGLFVPFSDIKCKVGGKR